MVERGAEPTGAPTHPSLTMTGRTKELLRKASELSTPDRWVLLQSMLLLPVVWVGLRVMPLRRLLRLLGGHRETTPDMLHDVSRAHACARLVNAAARYGPFPSTCLSRSIVLWRLLRRRGINAEIRIGLVREQRPITAHSWVEVGGQPVNETAEVAAGHVAFDDALSSSR